MNMNAIDREKTLERINAIVEWVVINDADPVEELNRFYDDVLSGAFDIKPPELPEPALKPGDLVRHKTCSWFIEGEVLEIAKSGKKAKVKWTKYSFDRFRYHAPLPAYYDIDKLEKVEDETHD